jgi:hypothetical protein
MRFWPEAVKTVFAPRACASVTFAEPTPPAAAWICAHPAVLVESLSLENVGAIQPGCAHADQDIARSQLRNRFFHQLDHLCIACVFK